MARDTVIGATPARAATSSSRTCPDLVRIAAS
jgi:hypothetical protein